MNRTLLIALGAVVSTTALAAYPNLGIDTGFTNIGQVGGTNFTSGSGTIISPNHILTAKHVSGTRFWMRDDGQNISSFVDSTLRINHPTADITILEFAPNTFSSWYRPVYGNQIGTTATMVGFGLTANARGNGTGYNVVGSSSGIRRVSANVADSRQGVGSSTMLLYDLDGAAGAPGDRNTFGSGTPVSGEGGILSGDSGGAWLVQQGSSWGLFAVNSVIFDIDNVGGSTNNYLDWGDGGGAVDLNEYETWIESNAPVPEPASMIALSLGVAAIAARRRRRK